MRKFLLLLLVVLGVSSCKDPADEAKRTTQLRLELNDAFTQIGNAVETDQGRVAISDFKLYLSDIYVHYIEGDSALWADIVLIDFEDNSTLENMFYPVPKRQIVAVSFGLGVKPEWNDNVEPGEFDPNHPLSFQSSNGMHWGWETGYKFLVFDARVDTGSGTTNWPISYHVGTSELYRRYIIPTNNETGLLIFVENVKQLFSANSMWVNVKESPQTHTINNAEVAEKFRDAFVANLSIK